MSTASLPRTSQGSTSSPSIRRIRASDRPALAELIARDGLFTPEELKVSLELVDAALADLAHPAETQGDYRVLVADLDGQLAGYLCYGPTPMTEGTWDLYWI